MGDDHLKIIIPDFNLLMIYIVVIIIIIGSLSLQDRDDTINVFIFITISRLTIDDEGISNMLMVTIKVMDIVI